MVVIVNKGKTPFAYLSQPVLDFLKNPEYIDVYTRGSNIALFRADESSDGSFKVAKGDHATPYISLSSLVKAWNISPGVYDVLVEGDHILWDTQQRPSSL